VNEAVPAFIIAVTPAPVKSKYEADPCNIPSSAIDIALIPPPPPFKANDAVKA
jgi:hypothetical protein